MQRPPGVTVAALVMGLFTLMLWIFLMLRGRIDFSGTGPGWLNWPMLAQRVVTLALAVWAEAIAVGLLRMRLWARRSAVGIGGVFLLLGVLLNLRFLTESLHVASRQTCLRDLLLPSSSVWANLLFVILGGWWLVYFRLATVRYSFIASALEPRD